MTITTAFDPTFHPRDIAGQFSAKEHSGPEVVISSRLFDEGTLRSAVNTGFPVPQANDLGRLNALVQGVDAGANTAESIALIMGEAEVTSRQGQYYADAAGYLGLVEKREDHEGIVEYSLTSIGQEVAALDERGAAQVIRELAGVTPVVEALRTEGTDAAEEEITNAGDYSDATIARRRSTAEAWSSAIDNAAFESHQVQFSAGARARFAAAAAHAAEQLERAIEMRKKPAVEFCGACYMQLPVTGICGSCVCG